MYINTPSMIKLRHRLLLINNENNFLRKIWKSECINISFSSSVSSDMSQASIGRNCKNPIRLSSLYKQVHCFCQCNYSRECKVSWNDEIIYWFAWLSHSHLDRVYLRYATVNSLSCNQDTSEFGKHYFVNRIDNIQLKSEI